MWSIDSQENISKFDATRCQILWLNAPNSISAAGSAPSLQCFDVVGWAAGRASGL